MTLNHPPAPLDLVNAIRSRARDAIGSAALGITTADSYLREFEACLDGACPSNILQGVTPQTWQRLMKRASRTLVYHGDGLELGEMLRKEAGLSKDVELPPKTIAWTNVVVTTPTRDRDGDILETSGADLDPRSPHLFNHLPCEVVGRVLKQTAHTKTRLSVLLSFMATEFAENVATMYEHGALRTSHGFLPTKWEPLDDGEGFHILEFKILEVSGVSIPSNPDAGPTAFSRNKLTHPLLKEWGRMKFRQRRKTKPVAIDVHNLPAAGIVIAPAKPAEAQCTCSTTTERAFTVELKATMKAEHVKKLAKAMGHLETAAEHEDAAPAVAQLAKRAHAHVKEVHDAHDGKGEFTAAHAAKLDKAIDYCSTGMDHDQASGDVRKCFKNAHGLVKDVADAMDDGGGDDDGETSIESAGRSARFETKGICIGPADVRKVKSAVYHFKAIEHDDDAANAHVELARAAYQPLQDMLDQLDSDPQWHGYDSGKTDVPGNDDGKSLKAAKLGKEARGKINIALEHGESLATHKSATAHVKGLARHAVCHLKDVLGEPENDGTDSALADDDGDMSYYGGNPKSFERRCDAMFDEAIDALAGDGGDALITLAATGSRAGRIIVGHQSRQAVSEAE
jgi:hypothetical protein